MSVCFAEISGSAFSTTMPLYWPTVLRLFDCTCDSLFVPTLSDCTCDSPTVPATLRLYLRLSDCTCDSPTVPTLSDCTDTLR
eukprot:2824135-Pyramimonas_sp.AAC.1